MRRAWRYLTTLTLVLTAVPAARADTWRPLEQWRIDAGQVAPWAAAGTQIDPSYRGRVVRFQPARVAAAAPLGCEHPKYEWRILGPADLFEGNLPAPQPEAARRLGLSDASVPTLRITCPNAGFDFHRASDGTLRLGLDNVVWTLRPVARATTPAEVVQELLLTHFTHDMGFTRDSVAHKRAFLSPDLQARIDAYLATPQSPDEAPEINGDPFTDTQEYPDRFTLGAVSTTRQRAVVPVHFADADRTRRVDYVVVRAGAQWVVDDLVDERGESLRRLLRSPVADN